MKKDEKNEMIDIDILIFLQKFNEVIYKYTKEWNVIKIYLFI